MAFDFIATIAGMAVGVVLVELLAFVVSFWTEAEG